MSASTFERRRRARKAHRRAARRIAAIEREERREALWEVVGPFAALAVLWASIWGAGWLALSLGVR